MRIVSAAGFIATKYVAFLDRGDGDYHASHDLEDLLTVIDGRDQIAEEVVAADPALRDFVVKAMATLVHAPEFLEALPGHLPPDSASQGRLPGLRRKLLRLANAPSS